MSHQPFLLDAESRAIVLASLRQHCAHRAWNLLAAHVRSNHVHVIVESEILPERMMNEFKAYASRELKRYGKGNDPNQRRWARHGSTRWLWNDLDVKSAIRYVIEEQGDPMAVFVHTA